MPNREWIKTLISRHAPVDGIFQTKLPGLALIRCSYPTFPMPAIYGPTLCLVAQGQKTAMLGRTHFVFDEASYLIASVDMPVVGAVTKASTAEPYLSMQLNLDRLELAELADRYPLPAQPGKAATALLLGDIDPEVLDTASRLLALLDRPQDIAELAPLAKREIMYRLLTSPNSRTIRQMANPRTHLSRIARATQWMRSHYREASLVERAAEVAGMGRSTFFSHFRSITTMSPVEFRKQLRLQEARRLMLYDGVDVATAAFHVGYANPSHFSADFAKAFGAPPSRHVDLVRKLGHGKAFPSKTEPMPHAPQEGYPTSDR